MKSEHFFEGHPPRAGIRFIAENPTESDELFRIYALFERDAMHFSLTYWGVGEQTKTPSRLEVLPVAS